MDLLQLSLSLTNLPIFYQIILSELDPKSQDRLNEKIRQYTKFQSESDLKQYFYIHPEKKGLFTGVSALAHTLLDLRSEDKYFRSISITRYLSFKFALQLDLINEWHAIKIDESEQDFYSFFTAQSLVDEKKYQQAIANIESLLLNYSIIDEKLSPAQALFLIDCYNLYIQCFILLNNFNKAQFELTQLYFLIESLTNNKDIYISVLYLVKHKELLLAILKDDTIKINTILRDYKNSKKDIKDLYTLGMFTSLLALYNLKLQDFNKIEDLLLESGAIFSQLGSERLVNNIYYNLLALKLQQGDLYQAIQIFEQNSEIFLSPQDELSSLKLSILFSEIYLTQNDIKRSFEQIQRIIENKEHLYRIRDIDYWILLHSLADRHGLEELQEIANEKIENLFQTGNINPNLIYIYNVRKITMIDYSRGDFDKASKKLVAEKNNLINMNVIGFHFDLNLDLMRIYLKQYEFSKNKSIYEKILKLFDDLAVYINSTKSFEAETFLKQAKIFLLMAVNEFNQAYDLLCEFLVYLSNHKAKNRFIESIYIDMAKLRIHIENYGQNKFFLLVSQLNKYDLTDSIPTFDIFVPNNTAVIEELFRNLFIRQSLIAISILRIQRLNKFDLQELNINRIPGLMKTFE